MSTTATNFPLLRLKSIDEKDSLTVPATIASTDIEKQCLGKDQNGRADRLKLAAIYDEEAEIISILSSETNIQDIQRILAENDERGQPCIFYALKSRSYKALECLLSHIKNTECVIACNGESVLHVATKMGDLDILRSLLKHEFVSDLVDHVERDNCQAPLHLAAKLNHVEIAKELLLHEAKLDSEDFTGKSPLYMAACGGHADMLKVFLEHEKDKVEDLLFNSSYGGGIYKNLLHVAMRSGDESSVQVCLEQDPEIVRRYIREEIKHGDGYLIHAACKNGMEKCLFRIIEFMGHLDTLLLNRKDKMGFAPIHKAAMNNHSRLVQYIGNMSKRFTNETTENSQTSLILATQRGHIEVVQQLLMLKADFTISDDSDRTVLHYAIAYPEILKLLLKQKGLAQMLINAKEKEGYSPVHNAALRGLSESVRILLDYGADLNVFTNTSRSPLHSAVSSQCSDDVELVLANEPDLVNKADMTGKTPLHTAASYGSAKIVKCLLDNGALIVRDENLFSALHIASHKGHLGIVEILVAFDKNIIEWENKYGRTALLAAASTSKTDVVKYLLDSGALITEDYEFFNCLDWSIINNDKQSAMMMMCHDRWREIMVKAKHGSEGTMTKLIYSMPEVAHRALSNSMISLGHPDSNEHCVRYNFMCLQNVSPITGRKVKPLTAIKTMLQTNCYKCLCHPVCSKYLEAKWMQFGWKIYSASLLIYVVFLTSLCIYVFGIPSYQESLENKENQHQHASITVKLAMGICITFASVNSLKELVQLVVYKFNYFRDKVNYLECILYVSTIIFAVPKDGKIAVKNSAQWKACSVALFCAWLNLVMYLRRFASYGIIVLMMKKISATLLKVMLLLIFFLVAFAAAFTVIMNDRDGYQNFGLAMIATATMTMGEFDFKQTFLDDTFPAYHTFYWLRLFHLVGFLVVMPIIFMNLLLLAIDNTSSIMQQANLQKHIQRAKMIIDVERKRSRFTWRKSQRWIPTLEERPNKKHDFSRTIWEFIFFGPDFAGDGEQNNRKGTGETNENKSTILDMFKDLQRQNAMLQDRMVEIQSEFTLERNRRSLEMIKVGQDKQDACTQFCGYSESINVDPEEMTAETKRNVWGGVPRDFTGKRSAGTQFPGVVDLSNVVLSAEQDALEHKEGKREEGNDPELKELKELQDKEEDDELEAVCKNEGNGNEDEKPDNGESADETSVLDSFNGREPGLSEGRAEVDNENNLSFLKV